MSTHALIFLAAVGAGLMLLAWAASTIRTDPRGYTHVATFTEDHDVKRACAMLEHVADRDAEAVRRRFKVV